MYCKDTTFLRHTQAKTHKYKTIFYSKKVKDTAITGGCMIIINRWPDSIEVGEFDLTIPTITGDSTGSEFEG